MSKRILITGGGTGIGRGIALGLAAAGCQVIIAGRRAQVLRDACAAGQDRSVLRAHPVDVTDRQSVRQLVDWTVQQMGGLDVLVHAAGVNIPNRTMDGMLPEDWDHILSVNATGAYNCMHAVLPLFREQQDGLIINISSVSGKRASDLGGIAYCASKFAATALGTAVGLEESQHGIRVTNIYPGEVNTPLLEARPAPVGEAQRARMLQPEDFAALVLTLTQLPPHVHIPELVIKPLCQAYA